MKNLHLSYLALGAGAVLALTTMAACGSDEPDNGGGFNTSGGAMNGAGGSMEGAGGSGPGAGGSNPSDLMCKGSCCPTDGVCYGVDTGKNPDKVGDECLAMRDQTKGGPNGNRLQFRQTWARATAPKGNTDPIVYQVLSGGATLPLGATCKMAESGAATGFMQLLDVDLTDPDPMNHTTTSGYAPWFTIDQYNAGAKTNGLCMVEDTYNNPMYALGADQMSSTANWPANLGPQPMPQPWTVRPAVLARRMTDFNVATDRAALLDETEMRGKDGVFFRDDATGYSHGYTKLAWVYVAAGGNETGIAIPIREVETIYQANDTTEQTCMGAYRGDALPADSCASTDPTDPPWGWPDGSKPGEAPAKTVGYFLITELEQVYSSVLGRTLCTSYPGVADSTADGFPDTTCRASAKWDPTAADNAGLPTGDWCAATNSEATATCHDAFRSVTFHTFAAHDISDTRCPLSGYE